MLCGVLKNLSGYMFASMIHLPIEPRPAMVGRPSRVQRLSWRALSLLVLMSSSCAPWANVPLDNRTAAISDVQPPLRVTTSDGNSVVFTSVYVARDSLFGTTDAKPAQRVAIPLSNVAKVEKRTVSPPSPGAFLRYYIYVLGTIAIAYLVWTQFLSPTGS